MRVGVNLVVGVCAIAAIASAASIALAAENETPLSANRWVPSLAVTSGATMQQQTGDQSSLLFDGETGTTSPLRQGKSGSDRAVSPFVGGAIEIMTPALPFLPRLRLFATGEVLPTFAPERQITQEGQASRIRGPNVGAVLAVEEDSQHFTAGQPGQDKGARPPYLAFGENEANGQGMRTSAQVEKLAFGAKAGVSFAFEWRGREVRIKPSVGWIQYKVAVKGLLVDPTCRPSGRTSVCTNTYNVSTGAVVDQGILREAIVSGHDSGVFDGVGPGIDLEMQAGRIGPIGTAIFLGVHGYYLPGDRDIYFTSSRAFSDAFGNDTITATWRTRVAPWIYRGGVGVRFQWLGSGD